MKKPVLAGIPQVLILTLGGLSGLSHAQVNWAGRYGGLGVGGARADAASETVFGNDGQTPAVGWSSDRFQGDVYNTVSSMTFDSATIPALGDPPAWSKASTAAGSAAAGQLFLGQNFQARQWVYGAEVRSSFGSFGASHVEDHDFSATRSGVSDFEGGTFTFTNHGSVLSGTGTPLTSPMNFFPDGEFTMPYSQTGRVAGDVKFNFVNAVLGRIGYAEGAWLLYGVGGVAHAHVKAGTQATITESVVDGEVGYLGSPIAVNGAKTYEFAGSAARHRAGLAMGAGIQWQVDAEHSLRLEGVRHDFGSVDVTGVSSQTTATYRLRQRVKFDQVMVSWVKRF